MNKKYYKTTEFLKSENKFQIKLGLENIGEICKVLKNPQENFPIIHVAGTNGKGSVCAVLAKILEKSGFKTGLYTSPHLFRYTERIKINDEEISEEDFSEYIEMIEKTASDNGLNLTEFEILTVCAFMYFSNKKVDVAVLETGLGGRFDATNIVRSPILSVITSISEDHKDRLGKTINLIAFEKAGIIKQNGYILVSPENKGFSVIQKVAKEKNAKIIVPQTKVGISFKNGINYAQIGEKFYEFPLFGLWQSENLELVFETLKFLKTMPEFSDKITQKSVEEGLKKVNHKSRMQYFHSKQLIVDGAHNVDAAQKLKESLDFYFPGMPKTWIYGSLNTKEYDKIVKILFDKNDKVLLFKFSHRGSVDCEEIMRHIEAENVKIVNIDEIRREIEDNSHLTVVAGSFYMLKDIFTNLNHT